MHKYAYMAWDRNFSYFCDNWSLKAFRQATQNSVIGLLSLSDHSSHSYMLEQKALNIFILVPKPSFLKKVQNIICLRCKLNYA